MKVFRCLGFCSSCPGDAPDGLNSRGGDIEFLGPWDGNMPPSGDCIDGGLRHAQSFQETGLFACSGASVQRQASGLASSS